MKQMKTALVGILCVLALPSVAGKLVTDSLQSRVLGACVRCNVYLPSGFDRQGSEKYPVLYLLHGLYGNYQAWEERGRMKAVADELMASGESRKMVIVMPNAGGADVEKVWNGYYNMPGWNYEDFFFQELMPWVEQKYHIQGDKAHRAVSGLSMGGGGSIVYCQRHPDLFCACYGMSAWIDLVNDRVPKHTTTKLAAVCQSVSDHAAALFVEKADKETIEKLRSVAWFITCGDDDRLLPDSERLHQAMRHAGLPVEFRVGNGGHTWEYWHLALREALPFVSRNFGR